MISTDLDLAALDRTQPSSAAFLTLYKPNYEMGWCKFGGSNF